MNETCFGMKHFGKCSALIGRCPGYAACVFYKPIWKYEQDLRLADQRICRMPPEHQQYIADKYYQGNMPWKGAQK